MSAATGLINIADRQVGSGYPTLVIAEIGVNHDGSLKRALELVDYAADGGADAVKLQIFKTSSLLHHSCIMAEYQKRRVDENVPQDMLRRYELYPDELCQIAKAIRAKGLIPLATPFSPSDLSRVRQLELPAIKIASPDLVNWLLLRKAAALGRPLLVSTGAATMQEVETTVLWLREWQASFALLHCISSYPVDNRKANLCWISELARFDVPVGYSDHTTEELAGALAVAAGACIIEKHLTYDRKAPGPDHAASASPDEFTRYVKAIRLAERMRGAGGKSVLKVEEDVRRVSRQSLVLKRSLSAGQEIREADLTVQRPGSGISPAELLRIVGKRMKRAADAGTMLEWSMVDTDGK